MPEAQIQTKFIEQLTTLATKMSSSESILEKLCGKMDTLEKDLQEVKSNTMLLHEKEKRVANIKERLDSLEDRVGQINSELSQVRFNSDTSTRNWERLLNISVKVGTAILIAWLAYKLGISSTTVIIDEKPPAISQPK